MANLQSKYTTLNRSPLIPWPFSATTSKSLKESKQLNKALKLFTSGTDTAKVVKLVDETGE